MNENDLGLRFATGAENELEQVIGLFGERLLRYATAILCDYQEAENTVQDVFLAAYRNRSAFDGQNLSAWLYKITYNKCLNQRKKLRLLFFSEIQKKETVNLQSNSFSDEVIRSLSRLKPEDRALIYGRIIDEQSYEELAGLLGQSAASLRKRYERTKKRLASDLEGSYFGKELRHENI